MIITAYPFVTKSVLLNEQSMNAGGLPQWPAKMLVLRADTPKWTLPLLGGAVFSALTALWLTASVWFFTTSGVHL